MATRSHYELLGVRQNADAKAVKSAYLRLTRSAHPDTPTGTDGLFGIITDAYDTLRDPGKRAAYDTSLTRPAATHRTAEHTHAPRADEEAKAAARDNASRSSTASRHARRAEAAATDDARRRASRFRPLEPLVIAASLTAAFLLRFTGATAALFGVHPGDPVGLGARWPAEMSLSLMTGSDARAALAALVVATAAGTVGCNRRRRLGPLPVAEKAYALTVAVAAVGAGELLLPGYGSVAAAGACACAWAAWFAYLRALPRPASPAQWDQLHVWLGVHIRAALAARH